MMGRFILVRLATLSCEAHDESALTAFYPFVTQVKSSIITSNFINSHSGFVARANSTQTSIMSPSVMSPLAYLETPRERMCRV